MAIRGKVVGAALGALAGPFGALVGGLIGHLYDRAIDPGGGGDARPSEVGNQVPADVMRVLTPVAGLAAACFRLNAATDRAFAERALVAFSQVDLDIDQRFAPVVRRELAGGLALAHLPVDELIEACRRELDEHQRRRLLATLLAVADTERSGARPAMDELLQDLALHFGMPAAQLEQLRWQMLGPLGADYRLLGVGPTVSDTELKRAYRALAARLHPDRAGQEVGGSDDEGAGFRRVTEAFERIQAVREGRARRND